ncbi:MAG: CBS domain-containing protein [Desulfobacterales bacterium]|nr:CBS domain-containing protein [Desulfobacterales bacterium]
MTRKSPPEKEKHQTVITTHMNADFDALSSMLAAQKLYPDARIVFPSSQEKNLRNFFIKSMVYLYNIIDIKDIDPQQITTLVLVDTRQPGRIGPLASVLEKPGLKIHIYDHHPNMTGDIQGHYEVIRPTGATITILTDIIKAKGIDITPEEATIMCLGLYEDTGSFTFSSTTEADFLAAALLLSKGANLNIVSDMIAREISPQQLEMLNEMFQSVTHYHINGVEVAVATVTSPDYVPDFAFLVHKMIKIENYDVIFAVAAMGNKIYIVARSRIPEVDVGAIMKNFGGGGHAAAASANLKEMTLAQAEQLLVKVLFDNVRSQRFARDLMSSPAIMVDTSVTCRDAKEFLRRYNINALVVTEKHSGGEQLAGYITRQVIEKAIFHALDDVPVGEYMMTDVAYVGPEADLSEVQSKIIENKQRVLPVIEGDTITGVITRTDLLNILVRSEQLTKSRFRDPIQEPVPARTRNIGKFMQERLSLRLLEMLTDIGRTADEIGVNVFVVGGFVRDLFLYRPNEDIDIVIEGDGIAFAKKFASAAGVRIHTHAKFGTAVIIYPDGFKLDVASARLEYYQFPAALPIVEMGSIKMDLFRRDFTINTLSIQLNQSHFGLLVDFFSAQKDLKEKVIRVLHNLSFVEDPTRVFRAIRFEQRFGFSIGKLTSGLIENAVKMDFFKRLSGRRVFSELRLILEEDTPSLAVIRLNDYNLLSVIHSSIRLTKDLIGLFNSVKKVVSWYDLLFLEEPLMRWVVYFLALIRHCDRKTTIEICSRFDLPQQDKTLFEGIRFDAERCLLSLERKLPVKNSTLYRKLSGFKNELLLFMMAATRQEKVKRSISYFFTQLRKVAPEIRGQDFIDMGYKPGPVFKEVLQAVLDAKLDGRLKSRKDELAFAKARLSWTLSKSSNAVCPKNHPPPNVSGGTST